MKFGAEEIEETAAALGFRPDSLEKVFRLLSLLEREFLERLNGAGDIAPELLTAAPAMQGLIRDHPGLKWKALNVKKRLGVAAGDEEPTE
jgi:hypothetical protein